MSALPTPVLTRVLERSGTPHFAVGMCSVNGWRESMEDAHCIHYGSDAKNGFGMFGIFDGHNGRLCSEYIAAHLPKAIEAAYDGDVPLADIEIQRLALEADAEWLKEGVVGGSCGTFAVVCPTKETPPRMMAQIGNVGDSRVILARAGGVADPMTTDHKPTIEAERRRIERCGGTVQWNRVDGGLAVSRAFGDAEYKTADAAPMQFANYNKTQPLADQIQQRVIALPDVLRLTLAPGTDDFIILCCDGIFEADFTNHSVVQFAAKQMSATDDLAAVASALCEEAIARGSKDNVSCMILQFRDGTSYAAKYLPMECHPGPFDSPNDIRFVTAYKAMLEMGGCMPFRRALQLRHDTVRTTLPGLVEKFTLMQPNEYTMTDARAMVRPRLDTTEERREWYKTPLSEMRSLVTRKQWLSQRNGVAVPMPDYVERMQRELEAYELREQVPQDASLDWGQLCDALRAASLAASHGAQRESLEFTVVAAKHSEFVTFLEGVHTLVTRFVSQV